MLAEMNMIVAAAAVAEKLHWEETPDCLQMMHLLLSILIMPS